MKTGFCMLMIFLLTETGFTPERVITGKVTSKEDGSALPGVNVVLKGTTHGTVTDHLGRYSLSVPSQGGTLVFSFIGFLTREVHIGTNGVIDVTMVLDTRTLNETAVSGYVGKRAERQHDRLAETRSMLPPAAILQSAPAEPSAEEYEGLEENIFHGALKKPLSTFSIDVDAASYSNLRRFINSGQRPPEDAVRIEEMINYFDYDYTEPQNGKPFSIYTEIAQAPWNEKHLLVHIGLQGRKISVQDLPPSNLVFLIDVSGSMAQPNKLPLVKSSFRLLIDQLRAEDHIAIVVYARAAGTVLEPTTGNEKRKILAAIDNLNAGGSTAGGEGLRLAYSLARQHFQANANNRVILATDGDFNVGESSNKAMEDLIEEKRKEGVFLTVLGFGTGNLKDSKMETLADKGNGNYAYIDNLTEARKVLVNEFGGTLFTIATDVKLQVEFNPAKVQAYRLVGYENRKLNDEDFNNDKKDAGDFGSGHSVTALYEVIPVGVKSEFYSVDNLKYQLGAPLAAGQHPDEWLTVKFRYKNPGERTSNLIIHTLSGRAALLREESDNFRWAAAVAGFGMLLTDSQYLNGWNYDDVLTLGAGSKGKDIEGYRSEFLNLVRTCRLISKE
jgi:Ca-activated chloride channel family protein